MPSEYTHGGSAGDTIYALAAVKDAGGGGVYLNRSAHEHYRMTPEIIESLLTLIRVQPYVTECGAIDGVRGTNLDRWRNHWKRDHNLADMVSSFLGIAHTSRTDPWLFAPAPKKVARVIMHRSPRYHVDSFDWGRIVAKYGKDAVFVGDDQEHQAFTAASGPVEHRRPENYLELANWIKGSDLFIGNQSSPAAVAQGLRVQMVVETVPRDHWAWNVHFGRPGAWYDSSYLPDLDPVPVRRIDQLPQLVPFREFTPADQAESIRHLNEDLDLYAAGNPRFVCSLLGTLEEQLKAERPDLLPLIWEAVWMARRMNDRGKRQQEINWQD